MALLSQSAIEDRVFELLSTHTTSEIAADLGISWSEAAALMKKVYDERSSPGMVEARAALERMSEIRLI